MERFKTAQIILKKNFINKFLKCAKAQMHKNKMVEKS